MIDERSDHKYEPRLWKAQAAAREILREMGVEEPPVDADAVARHLGLEVIEDTMEALRDWRMENPFEDGRTVLVVDSPLLGLRRELLAHEIGRCVLHGDGADLDLEAAEGFNPRGADEPWEPEEEEGDLPPAMRNPARWFQHEREAEAFVRELLVPSEWLRREGARRDPEPGWVAARCRVSVATAAAAVEWYWNERAAR